MQRNRAVSMEASWSDLGSIAAPPRHRTVGSTGEEIVREHPTLEAEDVREALRMPRRGPAIRARRREIAALLTQPVLM